MTPKDTLDKPSLGPIRGSRVTSDRQALTMRTGWRRCSVEDDHVPRRATGHLRPLARRCLSAVTVGQCPVPHQPVDYDPSDHAQQVTRPGPGACLQLCSAGERTDWGTVAPALALSTRVSELVLLGDLDQVPGRIVQHRRGGGSHHKGLLSESHPLRAKPLELLVDVANGE